VGLQLGTNLITVAGSQPSGQPVFGGSTVFIDLLNVVRAAPLTASLSVGPTNLVLTWTGGVAPFTIEQSATLAPGDWVPVATASTSASLPFAGTQAFYRVRTQ
jgi:hypothetical protein